MDLRDYIRNVEDFPKPGISFKDITPLLSNPKALTLGMEELLKLVGIQKIDKVVGIESRGFFFATLLAQKLQAGFVPIRKPGKLPYQSISKSYTLEYNSDTLEMHRDAIEQGDRVLLHDDVLATGGTAKAACALIEELGGTVVQCNFLMELSYLKGRKKIEGYDVKALLTF